MNRLGVVSMILGWYVVSTTIVFVTKWELSGSGEKPHPKFPYPIAVTLYTNVITSLLSFAVSRIPRFRPEPLAPGLLRTFVLPIAACVALEISCSNTALRLLDVSFQTILKGSAPVFVMLWAVLLRLEQFSWRLLLSVTTICTGIGLATAGEVSFNLLGFFLMLLSVAVGGLRWALTHSVLQGPDEKKATPLVVVLYTAPMTALLLVPVCGIVELRKVVETLSALPPALSLRLFAVLTGIGALVFALLFAEYVLVRVTSSLTVSIAGIFKELVTLVFSVIIFDESLSLLNIIGFLLCQAGIVDYIMLRYNSFVSTDGGESATTRGDYNSLAVDMDAATTAAYDPPQQPEGLTAWKEAGTENTLV